MFAADRPSVTEWSNVWFYFLTSVVRAESGIILDRGQIQPFVLRRLLRLFRALMPLRLQGVEDSRAS